MFLIHETNIDKIFTCDEIRKKRYADAKKKATKENPVTLEIYAIEKQKNGDLKITKV